MSNHTMSPNGDNPTQKQSLPCWTCSHYDFGEFSEVSHQWEAGYCCLGLWLPVRKMTCKRHSSRTTPAGGAE